MQLFSLFHLYGLIIGIAIVVSLWLVQKKYQQLVLEKHIPHPISIDALATVVIICGIIGARIWHVVTDYALYIPSPIEALYVWHGGLSIIGGIIGGALGLYLYTLHSKANIAFLFDLVIFGLPIGQAIGRIGNYVNQELYGLPTQLPWKLFIEPEYRITIFKNVEYYHPLFLYELFLTVLFGIWIWFSDKTQTTLIGKQWYVYLYLSYYCTIRVLLEFLRVEKTVVANTSFGFNQLILTVIAVYSYIQLARIYAKK